MKSKPWLSPPRGAQSAWRLFAAVLIACALPAGVMIGWHHHRAHGAAAASDTDATSLTLQLATLLSTTVLSSEIARVHVDWRRWLPSVLMSMQLLSVHFRGIAAPLMTVLAAGLLAAAATAAALRRRGMALVSIVACGGILTSMVVHVWATGRG